MKKISFNNDWSFIYGDNDWLDSPKSKRVDLPHDYIIELPRLKDAAGGGSNGYFGEGRGEYTKVFDRDINMTDCVILNVDGAYMNCEVVLNGVHLATHPYGYTAFQVELTDALRDKDNRLTLITQSRQPSTRWYSGGGPYREVSLLASGSARLNPLNVFIKPTVAGQAAVVEIEAEPDCAGEYEIKTVIYDADGNCAASGGCKLELNAPKLWSVDEPYLYKARVALIVRGEEADVHEEKFGVRLIEIDARNGFRLNGEPMKLKGGCIHHDNGALGAAAFPAAEIRKVKALKALGYNAIRSSHYPPSTAMLEACDSLGMLVMDEAFDVWTIGKKSLDYHLYFRDWWKRDIESMVRRDRNHACVFSWSIGNEIEERDALKGGAHWAYELAAEVRKYDDTRPITSALNNIFTGEFGEFPSFDSEFNPIEKQNYDDDQFAIRTEEYCGALDIVGYNYLLPRYAHDRELYRDRVIMGTETFATNTYDYWQATLDNQNVVGDFIWTAVDYLGEAGLGRSFWEDGALDGFSAAYPWALSYDADLDITMERRPQSYYREIMWGRAKGPVLMTFPPDRFGVRHTGLGWEWQDVAPIWNYDGKFIGHELEVFAYADCDEVEFILNGASVCVAPVVKLMARAVLKYAPGKLEAVSKFGGVEVGRCQIVTTGSPARIRLTCDRAEIERGAGDLSFVRVEIVDENGCVVPDGDRTLFASVSGAGTLGAFGNADPFAEQVYGVPVRDSYRGRALVVVRSRHEAGEINLTVSADGLPAETVTIKCV